MLQREQHELNDNDNDDIHDKVKDIPVTGRGGP
jgi:hypothetical protein